MTNKQPEMAPAGVDLSRPSAARVYDWYLGGSYNWAVDREFGQSAIEICPLIPELARQNRRWLQRVVRSALRAGITQFVDLGAGVPTVGAVHEIVAERTDDPAARVVYVDNEPVAATHSELILEQEGAQDWAGVVQGDMRRPDQVLHSEPVSRLIDFDRPVCVLMVAVLHFVEDGAQAAGILRDYADQLVSGSWVALSHIAKDGAAAEQAAQLQRFVDAYQNTQNPCCVRENAEIREWFTGMDLLEPGVVSLPDWRPHDADSTDGDTIRGCGWCGVAAIP